MKIFFHFEVSDVVLRAEQLGGVTARRERSASFEMRRLSMPAKQALLALLDLKEFNEMLWAANGHQVKQAHVRLVTYHSIMGSARERVLRFDTSWPGRPQIETALIAMAGERERTIARARRQASQTSTRIRRLACPITTFPSLRGPRTA